MDASLATYAAAGKHVHDPGVATEASNLLDLAATLGESFPLLLKVPGTDQIFLDRWQYTPSEGAIADMSISAASMRKVTLRTRLANPLHQVFLDRYTWALLSESLPCSKTALEVSRFSRASVPVSHPADIESIPVSAKWRYEYEPATLPFLSLPASSDCRRSTNSSKRNCTTIHQLPTVTRRSPFPFHPPTLIITTGGSFQD